MRSKQCFPRSAFTLCLYWNIVFKLCRKREKCFLQMLIWDKKSRIWSDAANDTLRLIRACSFCPYISRFFLDDVTFAFEIETGFHDTRVTGNNIHIKSWQKFTLCPSSTTKVPYAKQLDSDEIQSNLASHLDQSCLTLRQHIHKLWATLKHFENWNRLEIKQKTIYLAGYRLIDTL